MHFLIQDDINTRTINIDCSIVLHQKKKGRYLDFIPIQPMSEELREQLIACTQELEVFINSTVTVSSDENSPSLNFKIKEISNIFFVIENSHIRIVGEEFEWI